MIRKTAMILAVVATPAFSLTSEERQACDAIGTLANVVMAQRQAGMTLEQLLPYAAMGEGPVRQIAEDMIRSAFTIPMASSAQGKATAAQQFQRSSVANCEASYGG